MRWLWFGLVALVSLSVMVQAYSSGPPASNVVAADGCTCHSTSPNAGTAVNVAYPANYLGAAKHSIRITSTTDVAQNPAGNKGGFLAWVSHGTFAKREGSQDWYVIESLDGKSVIKHNLNGDSTNAAQEWQFDWTPPATDVGVVTLKVWVNRVNGDGSANALDHWNRKHVTMQAQPHGDPTPTSATTQSTPTTTSVATTPATTTRTSPADATGTVHQDPSLSFVAASIAIAILAFVLYRRR